eukprot:c23301_g1_i1 orf=265-2925(-)
MATLLMRRRHAWRWGAPSCRRPWSSCSTSSSCRSHNSDDSLSVDVSYPAVTVWGANTNVGKTLISAGLSSSLISSGASVSYLKPLQTGFPHDSDSLFVINKVRHTLHHVTSETPKRVHVTHSICRVSPTVLAHAPHHNCVKAPLHVEKMLGMKGDLYSCQQSVFEANPNAGDGKWFSRGAHDDETPFAPSTNSTFAATTLWSWFDAVSPHIAAAQEGLSVMDSTLVNEVTNSLSAFSQAPTALPPSDYGFERWAIIETAGGVASPGPSGTLQCDLYRPLRLPGLLVGDGKLGGISSTITAYESLLSRGYDVDAIVLIDHHLGNGDQLLAYLHHRFPVFVLPMIPKDMNDDLIPWFTKSAGLFAQLQEHLKAAYTKRISRLRDMQKKGGQLLWWPFTQHSLVSEDKITVIDARVGNSFMIYKNTGSETITPQFDACASWWTQGPDLKLQLELARQVGYATGRYGHVMLPENVYEPVLHCAELLIRLIGKGWADRVYYSDNGSTAVEIAIKMAFRKYLHDRNLLTKSSSYSQALNLKVLALKDSYHGDTLGAQEAQAPSAYTGFLQQPWYQGRGLFLDSPYIFMHNHKWQIHVPESYMEFKSGSACDLNLSYQSRDDFFDKQREDSQLATMYKKYIESRMSSCKDASTHIAGLIIEPVIHGAAGMTLVDPLFQRLLVKQCKSERIPVIFDEVFAGCWRLGVQSCAEYLDCTPDIGCYSKLLTGGVVPLAVTLASSAVFEAFKGDSKLLALLHGHSYSGHSIGCQAAITSLQWLSNPERNPNLLPCRTRLLELWDPKLVAELSAHSAVKRVIALGTVFALELKANASESGYASMVSRSIVDALRENGIYNRPLGNVIYFMCGPTTPPLICTKLLLQLSHQLDDFSARRH